MLRVLRGREEIARLTARLRSEHDEYESASQSWSPEAGEKKKELRKARADTWVEIGAALTWLGEVDLYREIERLPFEQKLGQLDAFLEEDTEGESAASLPEGNTPADAAPPADRPLEDFLEEDTEGEPAAPSREADTPPGAISPAVASLEAFLRHTQVESAAIREGTTPLDAVPHASAEPFTARSEPEATREALRSAKESTLLASLPPRSMRPRSRRSLGYWPMRLQPPAMPRAATTWRVPFLVGVIAVQGVALAVLAIALLRVTPRSLESEPSRAATSNATAASMATATPLQPLQPPPPQPAGSAVPSEQLPVAVPADDPPPASTAQAPKRVVPPPRSKPTAVASPSALARQPEIFNPDTL